MDNDKTGDSNDNSNYLQKMKASINTTAQEMIAIKHFEEVSEEVYMSPGRMSPGQLHHSICKLCSLVLIYYGSIVYRLLSMIIVMKHEGLYVF